MDERERRIGENEALFREVNEKVEGLNRTFAVVTKRVLVLCECGRQDCLEKIDLSTGEYEQIRDDATLFVIRPGHEFPDVEDLVEQGDDYWIVRKREGGPARLAQATDPRG
jgi:hypothetical protein